jgi:hypothetical protein
MQVSIGPVKDTVQSIGETLRDSFVTVLADAEQTDERADGRVGVIELAGDIGRGELRGNRRNTGFSYHFPGIRGFYFFGCLALVTFCCTSRTPTVRVFAGSGTSSRIASWALRCP